MRSADSSGDPAEEMITRPGSKVYPWMEAPKLCLKPNFCQKMSAKTQKCRWSIHWLVSEVPSWRPCQPQQTKQGRPWLPVWCRAAALMLAILWPDLHRSKHGITWRLFTLFIVSRILCLVSCAHWATLIVRSGGDNRAQAGDKMEYKRTFYWIFCQEI